uniref:Uncharacterized protein n=1 Tax=Amphimedon queenslandica TaxID=400682 RepID=A0A1X7UL25_AMPQE
MYTCNVVHALFLTDFMTRQEDSAPKCHSTGVEHTTITIHHLLPPSSTTQRTTSGLIPNDYTRVHVYHCDKPEGKAVPRPHTNIEDTHKIKFKTQAQRLK